jgi:hypothetical protein
MQANETRAAVLLDEIHDVLLQRRYGQLPALTQSLEEAMAQSAPDLDASDAALIRRKADRNAATLGAIQRGIKAAIRRIAEIKAVSNGMVTYDKSGRRQEQTTNGLAQRL